MGEPRYEIDDDALDEMRAATLEMRDFARMLVCIQEEWRISGAPTPSPVMRLCALPLPRPAGVL